MEQGSDEWKLARLGRVTASRVADILAKKRKSSEAAASREAYLVELVTERLTGVPTDKYVNAAMAWGTENEAAARDAYSARTGLTVEQVGFIDHPLIPMCGASPDGLIVEHPGLVEIKCPTSATHIDTLISGEVPPKYKVQMQWQMSCTGREWCDFVSYDPRLPENMQIFVRRVLRDSLYIAQLEEIVAEFLEEVEAKIKALHVKCSNQ